MNIHVANSDAFSSAFAATASDDAARPPQPGCSPAGLAALPCSRACPRTDLQPPAPSSGSWPAAAAHSCLAGRGQAAGPFNSVAVSVAVQRSVQRSRARGMPASAGRNSSVGRTAAGGPAACSLHAAAAAHVGTCSSAASLSLLSSATPLPACLCPTFSRPRPPPRLIASFFACKLLSCSEQQVGGGPVAAQGPVPLSRAGGCPPPPDGTPPPAARPPAATRNHTQYRTRYLASISNKTLRYLSVDFDIEGPLRMA
jgi:hypothetical protein